MPPSVVCTDQPTGHVNLFELIVTCLLSAKYRASSAGLICSTMLLSIVTVDAAFVRDYRDYLARTVAKQQGGPQRGSVKLMAPAD